MFKPTKKILLPAILLLATTISLLAQIPQKPVPARFVNDYASLFSDSQVRELEKQMQEFSDTSSNQITIVTTEDLGGLTPAEYATQIGDNWGVGSSQFNNGIVVLVKPKLPDSNGEIFIAVGYGLEGAIPDAYCQRITHKIMLPYFKENDYYTGVKEGCNVIAQLALGEYQGFDNNDEGGSGFWFFAIIIVLILLLGLLASKHKGGSNKNNSGGSGTYIPPVHTYNNDSFGRSSGGSFRGGSFGGGKFGGGGGGSSW